MDQDISLYIHVHEDESSTIARSVLELRGDHFEGVGRANRRPTDPLVPLIGEELAIARSLAELETRIMEAARDKITLLPAK